MSKTNITHRPTTQVLVSPYCRIDVRDPNPESGNLVLLHLTPNEKSKMDVHLTPSVS